MKGFIKSLWCSMGLNFTVGPSGYLQEVSPRRNTSSATSSDIQRSFKTLQSKYAFSLITCCSFCCFTTLFLSPHCWFEAPGAENKWCPRHTPAQEQESSVFTPRDKTFDQITCLSCRKCLTPGRLLPYLILSELRQVLTSEQRDDINLEVR